MIAIVDSGSTKSDWVLLDIAKQEELHTETLGFNPFMSKEAEMLQHLEDNEILKKHQYQISQIYFYGAGCTLAEKKIIILDIFQKFFPQTKIEVNNDLLAAALAVYTNKPCLVCILGTGSNVSYFDGKELYENNPSLGYILGDEGSGNHIGKKIVKAYFLRKLPPHLMRIFEERYELTIQDLYQNIYHKTGGNRYLATFSRFAADHKHEPFIQQLIYKSMYDFFEQQIVPYVQSRTVELNFVGSIAYYFEEILKAIAHHFYMDIGLIIRKPIDNLVKYHIAQLHYSQTNN